MYKTSIYDRSEPVTEGVLNHLHKFVYHGSLEKYETLKPLGIDFGNAVQRPGWSIYTFTDKDSCIGWCTICRVMEFEKTHKIHYQGSSFGTKIMLTEFEYADVASLIERLSKSELVFYIYTIKVLPEYELGFGHSSNTKNCITIRNEVAPYKIEEMYLTKDILDAHVDIVPEGLTRSQLIKRAGQNGRFLTPLMSHDTIFNVKIRRPIKDAVAKGILHPGNDDELNQWIADNNIQFHKPTIRERLFI